MHDGPAHLVQVRRIGDPQRGARGSIGDLLRDEVQRTALALFYLDQFDHEDLLTLAEVKTAELAKLIADGRQQFQAWLDITIPHEAE